MSKITLGLLFGAVLGLIDGTSALFYDDPQVTDQIVSIIIGSTFKGLLTGLIAGWYARRVQSLGKGIVVGLLVGAAWSLAVAAIPQPDGTHYWLEITLPGAAVGAIVGFATQKYGLIPANS